MQPCPTCRRHVRDGECPFCGAQVALASSPRSLGRVSRAVVFASATLAAGACAHKQKHEPIDERDMGQDRHAGGGGCSEPDQARIDALEKQKAEAKTDDEKAALDQQLQQAKQPVCMPYGAPPRRARVV